MDQQDLKTAGTHKLLEIWQAAVLAAAAVAVVVVAVVAVVGPLDCTSRFGEGLCVVSAAAAGLSVASLAVQTEILALESSSLMVKSLTPYPSCFQLVHVLALKKTSSLILQGLQHSWHSYPLQYNNNDFRGDDRWSVDDTTCKTKSGICVHMPI